MEVPPILVKDSIIFSLIERSQYRVNSWAAQPVPWEMSLGSIT